MVDIILGRKVVRAINTINITNNNPISRYTVSLLLRAVRISKTSHLSNTQAPRGSATRSYNSSSSNNPTEAQLKNPRKLLTSKTLRRVISRANSTT